MDAAELERCAAWHRPHDCRTPGACRDALLDMLADLDERARHESETQARKLAELATQDRRTHR